MIIWSFEFLYYLLSTLAIIRKQKMKNLILISIVSLFSITLVGQNKIEWSSDYKLAKEDYKAEAPNSGKQQTVLGSFFVGFQVANYTLMTTKNLNKAVSCYFQKDASYIDKGDSVSTAELLRYQQLIFNTYEINARYLRQKFFEERKRLLWKDLIFFKRRLRKNTLNYYPKLKEKRIMEVIWIK